MTSEKKNFQLERMILFSDAVFAIAITLLVIDLKVPEIKGDVTNEILNQTLGALLPNIIGFLLSFFLIGLYWTVHHRLFGFVRLHARACMAQSFVSSWYCITPFHDGLL